jgi:hypothetical protein
MNPFLILFLALPFLILAARDLSGRRVSLWVLVAGYMAVGWGLAALAVEFHFSSLAAQVERYASPPPDLLNQLQNDGAANVFAYYFGWAYAAIYFLLSLWVYYVVRYFVKRPAKSNA